MEESTKKKKKWNDDTFITEYIKKFDKSKYETVMCIVAAGMFLVPAAKLTVALAANFWLERLWVQCMQILMVVGILGMVLYFANVLEGERKQIGRKISALIKDYPWFLLGLLFIVLMIIGFFVNGCHLAVDSFYFSLFGTLDRNEGIFTRSMQIVICFGLALVRDEKKKKRVIQIILLESVYLTVPVIAQEWQGFAEVIGLSGNPGFQYMSWYGWHCSIFQHVNHYGYFLGMMVLLSAGMVYLAKGWKEIVVYGAVFALNLATLVFNNTFGSWLAALIATVCLALLFVAARDRKKVFKGLGIIVVFMLVSTIASFGEQSMWAQVGGLAKDVEDVATSSEDADEAGSGRWKVWKTAAEEIKEHPVFGGGEDCLIWVYGSEGYATLTRPANEYLQYAAFFGVPALLCYVGILVWIFVQKCKGIRQNSDMVLVLGGAVLAYTISACFGNTTLYTTTDFFALLGLLACRKDKENIELTKCTKK